MSRASLCLLGVDWDLIGLLRGRIVNWFVESFEFACVITLGITTPLRGRIVNWSVDSQNLRTSVSVELAKNDSCYGKACTSNSDRTSDRA